MMNTIRTQEIIGAVCSLLLIDPSHGGEIPTRRRIVFLAPNIVAMLIADRG
jgi:hypothetical protein